jgi:hypothetical protein
MESYWWPAVRGQLRTGILLAGVVVGVVVPRVGACQEPGPELRVKAIMDGLRDKIPILNNSNPGSIPSRKNVLRPASTHMVQVATPTPTPKGNSKEEAARATEETAVPGTTVNGQTLWQDGKGNKYYYINGDKNSPFISVEQPDGNFKWSTKNAMLDPVKPGQYGEIGIIETNGTLSKMYQLPDGSKAFVSGDSWLKSNPGQNSFTQVDKLTFRDGDNTLTQSPRVGYTEPYKFGGSGGSGSGGSIGNNPFGQPQPGLFGNSGGARGGGALGGGSGYFTDRRMQVPQSIVDQALQYGTPKAFSVLSNGTWQACYGNYCIPIQSASR